MLYLLIPLLAYLSAEAGASLPWSAKWQSKKDWYSEVPEALMALVIGVCGTVGSISLLGLSCIPAIMYFILGTGVAYAGMQTATFMYLRWTTHTPVEGRTGTLSKLNDFLWNALGFEAGDEGYSWGWASVKGLITTLPVGGLGVITYPLGHEVSSHAEGRLPGDPNMWRELVSGAALGIACVTFLSII